MAREYSGVPPGFRFHPTDEELVNYYLKKKVALDKFDLDVIRDVDLNKLEPWDLHEKCRVDSTQETDWYFFSHKDRKYPSGTRTNRATVAGFWKATGRDKAVLSSLKCIGMRKTLVFYLGRAPHGHKTDWIMHEYRLEDNANNANTGNEEGWVVCRVFKKRYPQPKGAQLITSSELDKNPLDHVVMPKLERNSNDHGLFMPRERQVTCKRETDQYGNINEIRNAQYNNPLMHEVSCLHLPQLESPEKNNVLENNPSNLNTYFELGTKARGDVLKNPDECFGSSTNIIFPSEFPTTNNNLSNESNKFRFVSEELLTEYCNTGGSHLGTDWGFLESLSKDINTRNEIDQYHENHAAYPMFQTISKEQLSEFYSFPNNSTDQGEFWSFISTR